jgi:hypothetical protein
LAAVFTLLPASPVRARNEEPAYVSWYNQPWNSNHTVIFVHGRSAGTNHSNEFLDGQSSARFANSHYVPSNIPAHGYWDLGIATFLTPHVCQSPGMSDADRYRCRMRVDFEGHWKTLGISSSANFLWNPTDVTTSRGVDFRNASGDCLPSLALKPPGRYKNPYTGRYSECVQVQGRYSQSQQYVCRNPSFDFQFNPSAPGGGQCTNVSACTGSNLLVTGNGSPYTYCGHRTSEPGSAVQTVYGAGAVLGGATTYLMKNAVFVGYDGDSSPADVASTNGALHQLDTAMWNYCDTAAGKSCTILCHSAGCYVTGMYMALGWGPGYHGRSGLIEVISTSNASGGSQASLKARECKNLHIGCSTVSSILRGENSWTPMIAALVPDTAMSNYVHGQQQYDYGAVPTYFLSGINSGLSSFQHSFLDWDKREDWSHRTANDGAVTLRSQCGGNWTCDHNTCDVPGAPPGNTMEIAGGNLCGWIHDSRSGSGYGYGNWYPGAAIPSPLAISAYACQGLDAANDKFTCNGNHTGASSLPDMRRIAVQWLTDVW